MMAVSAMMVMAIMLVVMKIMFLMITIMLVGIKKGFFDNSTKNCRRYLAGWCPPRTAAPPQPS